MGTLYLAFLLAPTILREGSILRVGEAQYEANQRFAENQRLRNNLRGSKIIKNQLYQKVSRTLSEDFMEEISKRRLDENLVTLDIKQLPMSVGKKSRILQQEQGQEQGQGQEGVLQAPPPAPRRGMLGRIAVTYFWLKRELRSHQESEFSLSLIFILSGAICFAVGILLTLHTYLGKEIPNILE